MMKKRGEIKEIKEIKENSSVDFTRIIIAAIPISGPYSSLCWTANKLIGTATD